MTNYAQSRQFITFLYFFQDTDHAKNVTREMQQSLADKAFDNGVAKIKIFAEHGWINCRELDNRHSN